MKISILFIFLLIISNFSYGKTINLSTKEALSKYKDKLDNRAFMAFAEVREQPLKWFDSIPDNSLARALNHAETELNANPGELYVFQIGVWSLHKELKNVQLDFGTFKSNKTIIDSGKMTCYNLEGKDFRGVPFSKTVNIQAGRVQSLWIGIDLKDIRADIYRGTLKVKSNGKEQQIPVVLNVLGETIVDRGYNQGNRLSRLNWLNSTVGIDDEIAKGYLPVQKEGNLIRILGRTLLIGENGLPSSINSFFDGSNEQQVASGNPIVSHPFRFVIEKENGEVVRLKPGKLTFGEQTPSTINWKVVSTSAEFALECSGQMEFDGFVDYSLKLTAKKAMKVKDIRLEIPFEKEKAEYMMGLNHEGGYRTPDWRWKWNVANNQDMLWLGAVNGGMRIKWKAENYTRPLVNIYYEFGPLNMPPSWDNGGKGGVNVSERGKQVLVSAYSGDRELRSGEILNYNFELLITPLKLINREIKYNDRYYHGGGTNTSVKISDAQKAGANIINIHHAEDIYPFINYPFLDDNIPALKQLVTSAHKANMRMKFYYTTRELTKNLPEFWPFNSLNGEVIFPGPGNAVRTEALHPKGPNDWLIKNLREKYIPAWYNPVKEGKFKGELDLSVITTPDSRLNNFYVSGLDWMVRNMGIDGVYIDDSALDRFTLRRARKIIDNNRPEGRIDMHSWNHFCSWAGFASCLNLYMDLLPYVDLVWIGEGRDYNRLPDHWLIEVSGIPFGLPGQMLEGGGNPWRGMVYGITNRAGWTGNSPSEMWKFWDEYKMKDKIMIGYWEKDCPVTCNNPPIKASVYKSSDDIIVAIANWNNEDEKTSIAIDWAKFGIDPAEVVISIPEIKDFQSGQTSVSLDTLTIPGGKGYLIVLKRKNHIQEKNQDHE